MQKLVLFVLVTLVTVFQFCTSSKKAALEKRKVTYAKNVEPIIQASCSPCHIAGKGKSEVLSTYESAKAHADEMIVRVQKNPGEKGFMPLRHPKLPDSTIHVFVKWKEDGLAQ